MLVGPIVPIRLAGVAAGWKRVILTTGIAYRHFRSRIEIRASGHGNNGRGAIGIVDDRRIHHGGNPISPFGRGPHLRCFNTNRSPNTLAAELGTSSRVILGMDLEAESANLVAISLPR